MDYVKLARTFIDDLLDRVEEEVDKLLQEEEKPKEKKIDDFGWYSIPVRVEEISDVLYGQRFELVTERNQVVDKSFSKSQLLERWGIEE